MMFWITAFVICLQFVVGLLENCDVKSFKCAFSRESHREVQSCLEMIMAPPPPPPHYDIDIDCIMNSITTGNITDANQILEKTHCTSTLTTETATNTAVPLPITTTRARSITTLQAPIAKPMSSFATKRPPIITRWTPFTTQRTETHVLGIPCTPVHSVPCQMRHGRCYPNIEDQCRSYYVCDWGNLYRCPCPRFTRFNHESQVCDWKDRVPCVEQ